ncbi:cell division control protein [Ascosphaera apis ARSEF 7405]|uniref:Cell division control protein n=1 Tax=Ascosphaera apis ARSEF 7405 TaxID=392613 RepID=A0A168ALI0_9EURO|nr:cell division control protein [Ascosphaera apis ARSEF 7405]
MPKADDKSAENDHDVKVPADFTPFMHPAAIQLCARKVASTTGDIRKAFELVRGAVDLVEKETMQKRHAAAQAAGLAKTATTGAIETQKPAATASGKTPLFENANLASRTTPPDTPGTSKEGKSNTTTSPALPVLTPINAPRVTVAHVARITSSLFNNGTNERLAGLNLQQKAALCALIAFNRKNSAQAGEKENNAVPRTPSKRSASAFAADQPTIKHVFSTYVSLCRRDNALTPLSASEFNDVISSLETSGLIALQNSASGPATPSRTPSRRARGERGETIINCYVNEKEVLGALKGAGEGILMKLVSQFD